MEKFLSILILITAKPLSFFDFSKSFSPLCSLALRHVILFVKKKIVRVCVYVCAWNVFTME